MKRDELIYKLETRFGYQNQKLINMDEGELRKLYEQKEGAHIKELCALIKGNMTETHAGDNESTIQKNLPETWMALKRVSNDDKKLYAELDRILKYYSTSDIEGMFERYSSEEDINVALYKKYRVKLRQFQEELIHEIDIACKEFPDGERYNFVEAATKNKENLTKLKGIHALIKNKNKLQVIERITNTKEYLLKSFFPEEFEKEYKDYFDIKKLKKILIDEILKDSETYTFETLWKRDVEELRQILEYIKKERDRIKKEREIIAKFTKLLLEATDKDNNAKEVASIIGVMIGDLSPTHIQAVIAKINDFSTNKGEIVESAYMRTVTNFRSSKKKK